LLKSNLIEIRNYCKNNDIADSRNLENFIAYCKRTIKCTRITPYLKKKIKLYFDKNDLDRIKKEYFA
jgi:hypothetical protein